VNLAPESYLSLWDADYPLLISKVGLLVNVDFEKDQTINLSIKSANVFFNAIENPPKASKKLQDAMKAYRESFGQNSSWEETKRA
jgi:hypothetical protein